MIDFPGGSGTLTMNETDKNTANTTQLFRPIRRQLGTVLNTVNPDNSTYVTDGALLIFGNDFNNGVDVNDAAKLTNFAENFGLQRNGKILSVERRKIVGDADTIFYSLQKMQAKKYQLQFVMDDLGAPASTAAFLEDLYLKKKTPVNMHDTTRIDFDITTNEDAQQNRFRLVFKRSVKYGNLNAFVLNSDIAVNWQVEDELNINHYEIERSSNG